MIVDDLGKVVYKGASAPLSRIVRLAWEYKPSVIALDNVFELADSEKKLIKIFSILPPEVRVVQVTASQGELKSVKHIAKESGLLEESAKLTPSRTAYVLAILSCHGYGTDVRVVEERTIINVSGRRMSSKGGWSQQRYQRRVRAAIQSVAEVVREALDRAKLDYDYSYRESKGGLESAVFTVYASYSKVLEVLPKTRHPDVAIKVRPVVRSKTVFAKAEKGGERLIIVGLDPGVTTGVAVLDASSGEVLYVGSGKNVDRGSLIDLVLSYGRPVVVATDVVEPPETVKKFAAQLGVSIYTPSDDLSVTEKLELTSHYSQLLSNSHERDALAAALKAYRMARSRIKKVERIASRLSLDIDLSEVKREILRGATLADALEKMIQKALEEEPTREAKVEETVREKRQEPDVSHYVVKIEELKERNRVLEAQLTVLEERVKELESKLRSQQLVLKAELLRDSEVEALRSRVKELERELERLKHELEEVYTRKKELERVLESVARGEVVAVAVVSSATLSAIKGAQGFKVVTVKNPGTFEERAIKEAIKMGIECFVLEEKDLDSPLARVLTKHRVPVVKKEGIEVFALDNLLLFSHEVLKRCSEEKTRLEREISLSDIERIVEEYRRTLVKERRQP
ncbi:MAG: DUF460 domain-containing protein [Acidilobaceae archaeon]